MDANWTAVCDAVTCSSERGMPVTIVMQLGPLSSVRLVQWIHWLCNVPWRPASRRYRYCPGVLCCAAVVFRGVVADSSACLMLFPAPRCSQLDRKVTFMMEYLKSVIEREGQPPQMLHGALKCALVGLWLCVHTALPTLLSLSLPLQNWALRQSSRKAARSSCHCPNPTLSRVRCC